jgi:hypothetical protein
VLAVWRARHDPVLDLRRGVVRHVRWCRKAVQLECYVFFFGLLNGDDEICVMTMFLVIYV